jgi:hypothetical protein
VRRACLAGLLLACLPLLSQTRPPASPLVIAPLYVNYTTDNDQEFASQAADLKRRFKPAPGVQLGFAAFLHMSYEGRDKMLASLDAVVERAKAHQLVAHVSVISGFFHDTNDLRQTAVYADVRNAQWFADGWIAEPATLKAASTVPAQVWGTPSRYARELRLRMEEGARVLGTRLAAQIAKNPETLVSISGDAEVEFSFERQGYADYSPFMVEEFRDWIRKSRYSGDLSPATDDNRDGRTFNRDFKQALSTWKLRYYEASGPIPFTTYLSLEEKLPARGPFFTPGGFDAPRQEKAGDAFWHAWTEFRKQVIANYVQDFATWITTSPDPVTRRTVPADRFYSHQIPADFLFGDSNSLRLKTSASYVETALLGVTGSTGVTVFNTYDGKGHKKTGTDALFKKLSGSTWGIFEYNPSVPIRTAEEPSADVAYYLAELRTLAKFRPRVIVPFAWTNEPNLKIYRIQDRAFETALRQFVSSRK